MQLLRIAAASGDSIVLLDRELFARLGLAGVQRLATGPFANPDATERAVNAMLGEGMAAPDHGALAALLIYLVQRQSP